MHHMPPSGTLHPRRPVTAPWPRERVLGLSDRNHCKRRERWFGSHVSDVFRFSFWSTKFKSMATLNKNQKGLISTFHLVLLTLQPPKKTAVLSAPRKATIRKASSLHTLQEAIMKSKTHLPNHLATGHVEN